MTSGVSNKAIVEFDFERLSPGIYKVWPRNNLQRGEYCFLSLAATPYSGAFQLMDFGLTPGQ